MRCSWLLSVLRHTFHRPRREEPRMRPRPVLGLRVTRLAGEPRPYSDKACSGRQAPTVRPLRLGRRMNMFVAGRDLIRWEVTAVNPEGPYKLVMHHARGAIVEYFRNMDAALRR